MTTTSTGSAGLSSALESIGNGGGTRTDKRLPAAKPVSTIGTRVGSSDRKPSQASGGSGIASPLVETSYGSRTYHADRELTSSDGVFTMVWHPANEMHFADAKGNAVTIQYKAPT